MGNKRPWKALPFLIKLMELNLYKMMSFCLTPLFL